MTGPAGRRRDGGRAPGSGPRRLRESRQAAYVYTVISLAVAASCLSCRQPANEHASGRSLSSSGLLEPLLISNPELTSDALRRVAISGVFGNSWSTGTCAFVAIPVPDGSYDVRVETHDFDGRGHTYRVGTCRILRSHADRISTTTLFPQVGDGGSR